MADTSPNQELLRALHEHDADAVGPALLRAQVLVPAARDADGALTPAGVRDEEDGSWMVVAFTDEQLLHAWRPLEHIARVGGRDLVDLAVRIGAKSLHLDPGAPHAGRFEPAGFHQLAVLPRPAGPEPLTPPGDWAGEEVQDAVRAAVAEQQGIDAAWLADRGDRPTVALALADDTDHDTAIQALIAALRPHLPQDASVDFLLLGEERRGEAEALGPPLR